MDVSGCSSLRLATAATAFSWDFLSFALFRFLTGAGIGGEYTAIASTIQEFVPARYRGWTDLIINGGFWIGAALGAGGSFGALIDTGSRMSLFGGYLFGGGPMLAAALIAFRFGVAAERKPLEAVATPLSAAD